MTPEQAEQVMRALVISRLSLAERSTYPEWKQNGGKAVAQLEPCLERRDVLAVDAARLLDVDLEAGALRGAVVARPAQGERGVGHVRRRRKHRSQDGV